MLSQSDIAVAAVLAQRPDAKFDELSKLLGLSVSKAFNAVQRLGKAGLLLPEGRRVNRVALLEFLEHGLRYVFPAEPGKIKLGVPTAHSGPVLVNEIDAGADIYVWPSPTGSVRGREIKPLIPRASELPERSPMSYEMLSLIDALRVGNARERALASAALRKRLDIAPTSQSL